LNASNVQLVFAHSVLDELDKLKWDGPNRRKRRRADTVVRQLDALPLQASPVQVRVHVTAVWYSDEPAESTFAAYGLSRVSADHRLLAAVLEFNAKSSSKAILIHDDIGIGIRARLLGIHTVKMPQTLRHAEEADEIEKKLADATAELSRLKRQLPAPAIAGADGTALLRLVITPVRPYSEARIQQLVDARRQRYPMATVDPSYDAMQRMPWQIPDSQLQAFGVRTPETVRKYNTFLEGHYRKYEEYLRSC
jgi:hypothetical protein